MEPADISTHWKRKSASKKLAWLAKDDQSSSACGVQGGGGELGGRGTPKSSQGHASPSYQYMNIKFHILCTYWSDVGDILSMFFDLAPQVLWFIYLVVLETDWHFQGLGWQSLHVDKHHASLLLCHH